MYIISACLVGINCKYSGENNLNEQVREIMKDNKTILICPEQLGGLNTPRHACEIKGGTGNDVLEGKAKVIDKTGKDVTENFIRGAEESLKIVKMYGAKKAILKANSPSCGCGQIYDGNFNKTIIKGDGVTAALFKRNGIEIITENDI